MPMLNKDMDNSEVRKQKAEINIAANREFRYQELLIKYRLEADDKHHQLQEPSAPSTAAYVRADEEPTVSKTDRPSIPEAFKQYENLKKKR
jgi:hypothetical protein